MNVFRNIELKTPFEVFQGKTERHYTYLDYWGRPVLTAHKSDLVEQHIQDFEVRSYTRDLHDCCSKMVLEHEN